MIYIENCSVTFSIQSLYAILNSFTSIQQVNFTRVQMNSKRNTTEKIFAFPSIAVSTIAFPNRPCSVINCLSPLRAVDVSAGPVSLNGPKARSGVNCDRRLFCETAASDRPITGQSCSMTFSRTVVDEY